MLRRTVAPTLLIATLLAAPLAGCGGSDPVDEARSDAEKTLSSLKEGAGATASSIAEGAGAGRAAEFKKVDGVTVRFVNTYATKGEGTDVDVYWGRGADVGKLATTVPYGTISDPLPLEVDADPLSPRADGKDELSVAFYAEGVTAGQPLVVGNEVLNDGTTRFSIVVGPTADTGPDGNSGGTVQIGQLDTMSDPPAGQAFAVINSIGLQAVDGGDFLTLAPQGDCDGWDPATDVNIGNTGQGFVADPGNVTVVASDANTECASGLPPVDLEIVAGGTYVLYAFGTSKDDRKIVTLDASE